MLVFPTFKFPLHLATHEEVCLLCGREQAGQHGEMHTSMTWAIPDGLSLGVQQKAARHTITLLTRAPGDTGLENYGVKKLGLVQSIVFQVDSVWKENSIKQLRCTWAFSRRVCSWSFLWFNKNVSAFHLLQLHQETETPSKTPAEKKNERLTKLRGRISISNLNNIKPILFKNKHKAFVWAVSHPRFSATEKWTAALWGGNANIKGWHGPALHSWDMGHPYRRTCFDDTHENTKKKTPIKQRYIQRKTNFWKFITVCVFNVPN